MPIKKESRISKLTRGLVTTGTVDKIMPYGAFVNIGEGLSSAPYISNQRERIKSPNEIIRKETVTVKILDIKDGKIA